MRRCAACSRTWTLEDNDVTLMFHVMTVGTAEEMIDAILSGITHHLGDENAAAPEPCSVRYGGAEHPARRFRYSLAGSTFENIGFGVDRDGGACTFFVLQHMLTDAGERTDQCQRLLELFEHTLVMAPK